MRFTFAILALTVSLSLAEKVRYDNYKLYKFLPTNEETLDILKKMEDTGGLSKYDFWSPVVKVGQEVHVLVPPDLVEEVNKMIDKKKMCVTVVMENVQEHIDKEGSRQESRAGSFSWTSYHTLEEYYIFLRTLASTFPNVVTLLHGGVTYARREILGVKVSFSAANKNNAIFLESMTHAREWISGAVNTYILHKILTSSDPAFRKFVERYDWYVFPVFNPDGYSFTHTDNRMWRKTMVPHTESCVGADPNRNWGYFWGKGGSSASPCSEIYRGPHPFSEPTIKSLSEFITTIANRLVAYISFHSFLQLLLIPYGYTAAHLDNYNVTYAVGSKAIRALAKRYGTQYGVGNFAETIYVATGSSTDWVKGTFGIPLVYTYELRDKGMYGFLIPAEQIIPTALETLDSLMALLEEYEAIKHK